MPLTQINQDRITMLEATEDYEVPDQEGVPPAMLSKAIENASDGETIVVEDGDGSIGRINECAEGVTVMARNRLGARIKGGEGDTISCMDGARLGEITFRGLYIEASRRSAVMTLSEKPPYRMNFRDSVIDGGYDHSTNTGADTKWGLMIHRWDGYLDNVALQHIRREHGAYLHTMAGDCLIRNSRLRRNGRTGVQHAGRRNEAGWSPFQMALVDVTVEDNGIGDGGSGITLGGCRSVYLENIQSSIGADGDFVARYMVNHPSKMKFSTGHLVNWDDLGRQDPVQEFEMVGENWFYSAPGTGASTNVKINSADSLYVDGELHVMRHSSLNAVEIAKGTALSAGDGISLDVLGKVVFA